MKALILDYGGVIALRKKTDFEPIFPDFKMWNQASRGEIPEEKLWQTIEQYTGKNTKELIGLLFKEKLLNRPLVDYLKTNKSKFKLGLINNGLYKMLEKAIGEWGLNEIFDVILNSAQEKISKPDPKIFLLACKKLGVKPQDCLYVDDKQKHVKAAKSLGMKGFTYTNFKSFEKQIRLFAKAQ